MSVDFDVKLTDMAAEILRDAVQFYDQGPELSPVLAAWNTGMLSGVDATGSSSAATTSLAAPTGSFRAAGLDVAQGPQVTLKRVFRLPGKLPGVWLLPEQELAAMARSASRW